MTQDTSEKEKYKYLQVNQIFFIITIFWRMKTLLLKYVNQTQKRLWGRYPNNFAFLSYVGKITKLTWSKDLFTLQVMC